MSDLGRARPRRVVMIASEVESLARTGGLGDMVEALSLALADLGVDVLVVTPRYGITRVPAEATRWAERVGARWGWGPDDIASLGIVELPPRRFASGGTRRVCLLEHDGLFARAGIYGDEYGPFGDNALRFAVMSRGALEVAARVWPGGPDVIHAHDWHATFAILYARLVMGERWSAVPSVFTVHNLQFQGVLDEGAVDRLHLPRAAWRPEILQHDGQVNLLKGATAHADRITTVSPTYAREILAPEGGFGLDQHLRAHAKKLEGILNGIDLTRWDPLTDEVLVERYDDRNAERARAANKVALLKELGLEVTGAPLFGLVARLSWQKGIDLVVPLLTELADRGASVVVMGQGDRHLEEQLRELADVGRGRIGVRIAFDPDLSRRIYAGSDFFLVPSRFEPCGLTQMYAMRYGAIPIVTDVGGLHDTVEPITSAAAATGTGFVAERVSGASLRDACARALRLHEVGSAQRQVVGRAMVHAKRFGWAESAEKYRAVYERVCAARG